MLGLWRYANSWHRIASVTLNQGQVTYGGSKEQKEYHYAKINHRHRHAGYKGAGDSFVRDLIAERGHQPVALTVASWENPP